MTKTTRIPFHRLFLAVVALVSVTFIAHADPLARPGDLRLRHDVLLLVDEGVINVPAAAWPIPWADLFRQLRSVDDRNLSGESARAVRRLRSRARWELDTDNVSLRAWASAAAEPREIRNFENTPREDAEAGLDFGWTGNRFTVNLSGSYAKDPYDGDEFRPDGTYAGVVLGNWIVTAGWQERWWGPGNEGSIILSTNARPTPGIALQRNLSTPFKTKWLSWMGPWSFTTFMNQLDDERVINNALLWGFRFSFRPLDSLEVSFSRTAQWCGDGRPCDLSTFWKLFIGDDNRNVNVDEEDEPGNQLGGIDLRWSLPNRIPAAIYAQWIGEDGRAEEGPVLVGSFSRQLGLETWGRIGGLSHRTHIEVSEISCRKGEFGSSERNSNCAYEHGIYRTGYRYKGRPIGHGTDGDGRSYSLGSTLVQSAGHTWSATIRFMEINFEGQPNPRHTLSPTPQDRADIQISHERMTRFGRWYFGAGYQYLDDKASGISTSDVTGFVRWSNY